MLVVFTAMKMILLLLIEEVSVVLMELSLIFVEKGFSVLFKRLMIINRF